MSVSVKTCVSLLYIKIGCPYSIFLLGNFNRTKIKKYLFLIIFCLFLLIYRIYILCPYHAVIFEGVIQPERQTYEYHLAPQKSVVG